MSIPLFHSSLTEKVFTSGVLVITEPSGHAIVILPCVNVEDTRLAKFPHLYDKPTYEIPCPDYSSAQVFANVLCENFFPLEQLPPCARDQVLNVHSSEEALTQAHQKLSPQAFYLFFSLMALAPVEVDVLFHSANHGDFTTFCKSLKEIDAAGLLDESCSSLSCFPTRKETVNE